MALKYKWGGDDGNYHSTKSTNKKFPDLSIESIKSIEDSGIKRIDSETEKLYQCPNCLFDIRKVGLSRKTIGIQTVDIYVDSDGKITRGKNRGFTAISDSPKSILQRVLSDSKNTTIRFACLNNRCMSELPENSSAYYFVTNKLTIHSIMAYVAISKKVVLPNEAIPNTNYINRPLQDIDIIIDNDRFDD